MAKQPETTKHAAIWNPPRFAKLNLSRGVVQNDGIRSNPTATEWEGACPPLDNQFTHYRMATSSEVGITNAPYCGN